MIHTADKPYQCNMCEKTFRVKGYFNAHLMNHTGEKPYQGNQVEKDFSKLCKLKKSTVSTVKIHLRIHMGEKPFKCIMGDQSFSWNCTVKYNIEYTLMKIHPNAYCVTLISNGYGNVRIRLETHAGGDYINTGTDLI